MAHLRKLPTYFIKGDDRRAVYYTVDARELLDAGYVEEVSDEPGDIVKNGKLPEKPVVAGGDGFEDLSDELDIPVFDASLEDLTKAELLEWAADQGHDLKNNLSKAEILKLCKEIEETL